VYWYEYKTDTGMTGIVGNNFETLDEVHKSVVDLMWRLKVNAFEIRVFDGQISIETYTLKKLKPWP
jgi:hypothetical protein